MKYIFFLAVALFQLANAINSINPGYPCSASGSCSYAFECMVYTCKRKGKNSDRFERSFCVQEGTTPTINIRPGPFRNATCTVNEKQPTNILMWNPELANK